VQYTPQGSSVFEGSSESPSKKAEPLGIKVTIVEPGGFRTDFAGSSTALREGRPEHDETVGATGCFQRNYGGNETMSLQRALSRTGLMRPNDAVGF
jgi:hypothetical protein